MVHDSGRVLKKRKNYVHIISVLYEIFRNLAGIVIRDDYHDYWLYVLVKFKSKLKMYIEVFIVRLLYLVKR